MGDCDKDIAVICEIIGDYQSAAQTQRRIPEALRTEWGFTEEVMVREVVGEIERLERRVARC